MAKCKACQAEIVFVLSVNGQRMPVDASPEKRIVVRDASGKILPNADAAAAHGEIVNTYISHFATCPAASTFKRKPGAE